MNFYKITNEQECHHGLQYVTGLNVDPVKFNPAGNCRRGGIYFAREDILVFSHYGPWIRQVTLPEGAEVYEEPGSPKKWKADKIILGERRRIDANVIKSLIDEGADIHAHAEYTLLTNCAYPDRYDLVKALLENGADVTVSLNAPIRKAAKYGWVQGVELFLQYGANIHALDDEPLIEASQNGHVDVVKLLLQHGANVHAKSDFPLVVACKRNYIDVVKILIEAGADVNAQPGLVNSAMRFGCVDLTYLLLENGANINSEHLHDLLPYIVKHNVLKLAERFIKEGAFSQNQLDRYLNDAVHFGHFEMTKLFLDLGADVQVINDLWSKSAEVAELLINYGAKVSYSDIHKATSRGNYSLASFLRKRLNY